MTTLDLRPTPQTAASPTGRFKRGRLDVRSAGGRETRSGYRQRVGDEQAAAPWGITRSDKTWAVWHLPTGLLVRSELPTLDAAKSLCAAFEANTASQGQNLPALASQPFGEAPKRDTEGHREALAVWEVLQAWLRGPSTGHSHA